MQGGLSGCDRYGDRKSDFLKNVSNFMKSEKIRKKSMQTDRFPPGFYFTKADNNASSFIWEIYELKEILIFLIFCY